MIEMIKEVLRENRVSAYLIEDVRAESTELFFIRKHMDMRRMKHVRHVVVTVYRDFEKDGTKRRGYSEFQAAEYMSKEELDKLVKEAYYAASFVANPWYELTEGTKEEPVMVESSLATIGLKDAALRMAEALYAADMEETTFINSAEIFVKKESKRILNSNGVDVGYTKFTTSGEFVAQCVEGQDVETYQDFAYDGLETESLTEKAREVLQLTKDRARAVKAPKAGNYRVILSGARVPELISYYVGRSGSGMIYPKYSNYEVGMKVQGEAVTGEKLNVMLAARTPYSGEGIKLKDRELFKEGELQVIHGGNRYARYLGIEATGSYGNGHYRMPAGTVSFEEMKRQPYLYVVNFSDFQMDTFSGHFGGEIRLAYLFDGETVTPVTGGSINGSILEAGKNLRFSKELQKEKGFEGPFAVCLENVSVAGE